MAVACIHTHWHWYVYLYLYWQKTSASIQQGIRTVPTGFKNSLTQHFIWFSCRKKFFKMFSIYVKLKFVILVKSLYLSYSVTGSLILALLQKQSFETNRIHTSVKYIQPHLFQQPLFIFFSNKAFNIDIYIIPNINFMPIFSQPPS